MKTGTHTRTNKEGEKRMVRERERHRNGGERHIWDLCPKAKVLG